MIREIKFRAWSKRDGMVYPEKKKVLPRGCLERNEFRKACQIMQFTGLKDKKGKEIFEGDIITWFADGLNKKAIVKWKFNGYIAERVDNMADECYFREFKFQNFIPVIEDKFDGEVIGNIYENPELLEVQKR